MTFQWHHETISLCCRHWEQHSHGKSQGANSCFARSSRHLPPHWWTLKHRNFGGCTSTLTHDSKCWIWPPSCAISVASSHCWYEIISNLYHCTLYIPPFKQLEPENGPSRWTRPNTLPHLVGTSLPCKLIQGGDRVVGHHGSHTNAWPGFGWVKREAPRNGYGNSKMDMPENSRELDMGPRFEHFLPHKKIYRLHDIHNHTWTTTIST